MRGKMRYFISAPYDEVAYLGDDCLEIRALANI